MSKSNQSHLSEHLQRIDESLRTITRLVHRHNEDVEVLKNNVVMLKDGYAAIRLGGIKVANG